MTFVQQQRQSCRAGRLTFRGALPGLVLLMMTTPAIGGERKPRARDLGIPFEGTPGALNAITDVAGVEVGHVTLIKGEGPLIVGEGPVRTGVTAILPRGRDRLDRVFAGWFSLNGAGEMTGTAWIDESGCLEGPVMITSTHSVGVVRDAVVEWLVPRMPEVRFHLPVVAETYDGFLNDANGFHVRKEHAFAALDGARSGPVAEGDIGGGTGMIVHDFKGGIGTASRVVSTAGRAYVVGVLVQANYGSRATLRIAGVPVGREIEDLRRSPGRRKDRDGSIIVVVVTDAPLLPHQLQRVARRAALGVARTGSTSGNSSGDLFLAFSTANPEAAETNEVARIDQLPNERIGDLFGATVEATEEAIVNAMVAAETMTGIDGNKVFAIPHDRLREVLGKYNRLLKD